MFDSVTLIGRVGADPETTHHDPMRVRFNLAVSRTWKDASGERQERTTWLRCVAWRGTAKLVADHVRKGRLVLIQGHHETMREDNPVGEFLREHVWITIDRLEFLDSPRDRDRQPPTRYDDDPQYDQRAHDERVREALSRREDQGPNARSEDRSHGSGGRRGR